MYCEDVVIYYKNIDIAPILNRLSQIIPIKTNVQDKKSYINLITESGGSLNTEKFNITNPKMNIPLAYGEDFVKCEAEILKSIKTDKKGLYVFHGDPGTGKTMFIRNIIRKLNSSKKYNGDIIYMSSDMVKVIDTPSFIPFISEYSNATLIIEDGDLALLARKNHGSIVNTILQLTDGILADCLKIKIIVTFNCPLNDIDAALLRKGRLTFRHEFKAIPRSQAIELAKWLKIDIKLFDTPDNKSKLDWTLAEVYNMATDFHWEKKTGKSIGFSI